MNNKSELFVLIYDEDTGDWFLNGRFEDCDESYKKIADICRRVKYRVIKGSITICTYGDDYCDVDDLKY